MRASSDTASKPIADPWGFALFVTFVAVVLYVVAGISLLP